MQEVLMAFYIDHCHLIVTIMMVNSHWLLFWLTLLSMLKFYIVKVLLS